MDNKILLPNLAEALANRAGISKRKAENFVRAFFELAEEGLTTDSILKIKGFATFKIVTVSDRESVNINTGERFQINGHEKVSFVPDAAFKELINRPFNHFTTITLDDDFDISELDNADDIIPSDTDSTDEEMAEETSMQTSEDTAENDDVDEVKTQDAEGAKAKDDTAPLPEAETQNLMDEAQNLIDEAEKQQHPYADNAEEEKTSAEEATAEIEEDVVETAEEATAETEEDVAETAEEATAETEEDVVETAGNTAETAENPELPTEENTQESPEDETPEGEGECEMAANPEEECPGNATPVEENESETPADGEEECSNTNSDNTVDAQKDASEKHEIHIYPDGEMHEGSPIVIQNTLAAERHNWWRTAFIVLVTLVLMTLSYYAGYYRVLCPPCVITDVLSPSDKDVAAKPQPAPAKIEKPIAENSKKEAADSAQQSTAVSNKVQTSAAEISEEAKVAKQREAELKAANKYPQLEGGDYLITGVITQHTISVGDNLYKLAKKHYNDKELANYIIFHNQISNPDVIQLGQTIEIPRLTPKP